MRKIAKKLTALVLAATMVLSPLAVHASETEQQPEQFEVTIQTATQTAEALMEALSIAGFTVAIVDVDSGFTWLQGFGYADAATQVPVTEYTLFSIGSTAKIFTAIAIMQLVEDGILDLDEPIVTYLPEFRLLPNPVHGGDYRNITTRMLLTHVSGIHEFHGSESASLIAQDRYFKNRLMPYLAELHMQNQEVNRVTYNNTAYTMLGILVARLTGSANYFDGFVRYTQENIFDPAGMASSSFEINSANRANIATPYIDATTPGMFMYVSAASAGSMVSNAYDMAQFMHIMLSGGGDILLPATIQEMRTPQDFGIPFPNDIPNMPMGLGLMYVAHADGLVTIGHGGSLHHHTEFLLDFDNGIGVFVSGNSATSAAATTPLATAILRAAVEEKTGQALQPTANRNMVFVTNPEQLTGRYNSLALGGTIEVVLCEEGAPQIAGIPGLPEPLALAPRGDGGFETMLGVVRFQEVQGIMFMFLDTQFGPTLVGERVAFQPSESIARWVGNYRQVDPVSGTYAYVNVGVDEDGIAYIIMGPATFLVNEIDPYNFHFPSRIREMGSVARFSMDGDTAYFRYSGSYMTRTEAVPEPATQEAYLRFVMGSTEYTLAGIPHQMDAASFMDTVYNRTMVPLRVIAEVFGAEVDWIDETGTATIVLGDINLAISTAEPLPGSFGIPHNIDGHIFVPLRYVAYAFGVNVDWDGANQAAYVFIAE